MARNCGRLAAGGLVAHAREGADGDARPQPEEHAGEQGRQACGDAGQEFSPRPGVVCELEL
eukprot:4761625-Prymnesium_polylepis.2